MPPDATPPQHPGPLDGLRVLDLTRVLAGPFCTMILADLGAEVVKIERPELGDDARGFGPFLPSGLSAYFASLNRGKKSIALDLKSPAGRETFERLVAAADVLVENFRPGTMEALGLAPQQLQRLNPRLIYASTTGFGRSGARSGRAAYDVIIQAMSGLMSITGPDGGPAVRVGTSVSDILAGMFTAIGILAALRRRDGGGPAADLDLAMLDCTVAVLENAVSRLEMTGDVPRPLGTRHPSITPFQAFATATDPIVVAAGNDALWRRLCGLLGAAELADEPRLATNALRTENHEFLEQALSGHFARRSADQWLRLLDAEGVPAAPIRDMAQVASDPELTGRGMLHRMVDGDGSEFLTAGSPLRIDGRPPRLSSHAPALGEHTAEVLRAWLTEP